MDLTILNTTFQAMSNIDSFESFIWTDRYAKCGDFELYTAASKEMVDAFKKNYYFEYSSSEHLMIIEDIQLESDVQNGSYLLAKGRSLESILERRIIWKQTTISGNLQAAIKKLLTENIISPTIAERKIENFIFEESTDPAITSLTITETQYTGDDLLSVIETLCEKKKIGYKIILNDQNQFVFSLYKGVERTYDQMTYPYVSFSPNMENIISNNYLESVKTLKTVTLVAGEGEGTSRTTVVVGNTTNTGLDRRELYTDARDVSTKTDSGGTLSSAQYQEALKARGEEKLNENKETKVFEGEVETTQLWKYQKNYFMGDIVQLEDEYGTESKARIIEYIYSYDDAGISEYPTFEIVQEEDESNG